ncbi:SNF2-related protein [Sunxiuqinia dokdonensis]|uniref:DEAD/DEAH box helicase n=1 Tax=Sunxiuqinia dokdonensis TaxID=1409788 RepID=A0A0L8VE12_9BACT|nr:SNF2-related protein [Sunxiuqinia dokdonensis]KOH46705.1 DEAD/DEAH box helicase [Sunxiuqinia dokdonensis]
MNLTSYHAKYFAHELTRKISADDLGKLTASLQDAKVDLNPHQVEAALFAFKSPLSKGALLADEVGLGKTIEAGIILSQKWAERKRKLLIIAPANLRKQWNQELVDKFYLPSVILEAKSFNREIKDGKWNPFEQNEIVICSYQFARSKELEVRNVLWDLVIIDEAHRLRNVYKPTNKIGNSIKESLSNSKKVLLTATPLQNSLLELYGLVSIIDDYAFGDLKSYKSQYSRLAEIDSFEDLKARLKPLCQRTLRKQVLEYINYTNRIALVEEFYPYTEETELYDLVSDYLQRDNLYALPNSQRQLMTLILRKLLASSTFAIQGTLEGLANRLEAILNKQEAALEQEISGNYELFEEVQDEWEEENDLPDDIELLSDEEIESIQEEKEELKQFAALAKTIKANSKGDKLQKALEKGFEKLEELGAAQKAIIFTESTRTQEYLRNILEGNGYNGEVVLFNGSNNDSKSRQIYQEWFEKHKDTDRATGSRSADMRQALVDYFRNEATIMIATEAAAEGINLQFCSLVVNYDLPWNPQRIEQRIGRCHRYGQKFDVVVINFLNKANAADQRVYQLLDQKFQLFNGVFGASDEVLGSIESGVDFEKRIAKIYQEYRSPEEIKEAFDKLQKELEPDIELKMDVTKKQLLENFDEEVHQKLKFNMEKGKEYLNQYEQWLWNITRFYLQDYAEFNHTEDSFRLRKNPFPSENIHPGPYLILRTKDDKRKTEIEIAEDTNVYRIGHPLAQRIVEACKNKKLPAREITFDYTNTPTKITLLEELSGKTGWLQVNLLTIASFENEEYLMLAGVTDDGEKLDAEICRKLFSVWAEEGKTVSVSTEMQSRFDELCHAQKQEILDENIQRNAKFFDEEYSKLDNWADDMKLSLEKEIKDIDAEIKLRKAEARKLLDLQKKVAEQRSIKDLEKKRNEKRKHLFEAQDQIELKKDDLLGNIEERLKQKITEEILFTLKWKLI